MNIIFVTMGSMYKPYFDAYQLIKDQTNNVGFYVSNKVYFGKNKQDDDRVQYLKEWEITEKLSRIKINKEQIKLFETIYFEDESFWNVLNNDRRIFLGKYVKHIQDYKPSYEFEDMLKLFQLFTENIENFIETVNPNIIFGITPATIGDYLFFRVARAKKIPYFNLKSVKISNFQTFTETISEEHYHIQRAFKEYQQGKEIAYEILIKSRKYLEDVTQGFTAYEGNVAIVKNSSIFKITDFKGIVKTIVKDIIMLGKEKDHHNRGSFFLKYLYDNPIKNIRSQQFKKHTKQRTLFELDIIEKGNYIFFPLHAEPEIAITNYARFYQNQIEFIRNVALQLPSKYKLLVKEHPRNIGRRSLYYYQKIIDIPNVDFADYELPSIEVVKRSKMVIVLSGNIGFEAVLNGIPVISFGNTMYNMLPKTMVNYLHNIKDLYLEIEKTIEFHSYSKETIEKYISAVITNSFPLDLYTVLLKKVGREGGSSYSDDLYKKNISVLSAEIQNCIQKILKTDENR